jgi:hypothetical protein
MTSSSDADLRGALVRVVVGGTGPLPDAGTLGSWAAVAQVERVVPLLHELVEAMPTDITTDQRDEVRRLQRDAMSYCVLLEHHLLRVARLLADGGVPNVVLKGAASAHLDYPTPSLREFADIDVLVDPDDFSAATSALRGEGWSQRYALPRGHERYTHAVTLERDRVELDLHQRIGHRAVGRRVPTSELLRDSVPFVVAGSTLWALNDTDRLIHAALHLLCSRDTSRRLSTVADVVLESDLRRGVAAEVLDRAEGWRVGLLVQRAIEVAHRLAQLEVPPEWVIAMRRTVRRRDRWVEAAYLGEARRPILEELAHLRLLPSWTDRWRYVSGYLGTEPDYALQHGRSGRRAQLKYLVDKVRPSR